MHGLFSIWRMDPAHREEQREGLEDMVIPKVRRQPGFVAGYWTHDAATNRSYSLVLFDTEQQARDFERVPKADTARAREVGIELEQISVVSVDGYDVADASVLTR